ncbi:MAG: signal peptidase I [Bacilli bacterium]
MDFRDVKEFMKDAMKYIIVIIIVLLLFIFVFSIEQIVGSSMIPTLNDGNITILNKLIYNVGKPKRNEIAVIKNKDEHLIKRVVGLPGEKIEYKDNYLYVDGIKYKETFLSDDIITKDFSLKEIGYDKIPKDMYLVLGDNRGDSLDSREIGLIKRKNIIGRVSIRFWPLNKIGIVR